MLYDKLVNTNCKWGTSPNVYPALVKLSNGETVLAIFTQHQFDVACKRGKKYPELIDAINTHIENKKCL